MGLKSGGDVEFFFFGGYKKEMNDGVEFVVVDLVVGVYEFYGGWSRVGGVGGDLDGFVIGLVGGELKGGGWVWVGIVYGVGNDELGDVVKCFFGVCVFIIVVFWIFGIVWIGCLVFFDNGWSWFCCVGNSFIFFCVNWCEIFFVGCFVVFVFVLFISFVGGWRLSVSVY